MVGSFVQFLLFTRCVGSLNSLVRYALRWPRRLSFILNIFQFHFDFLQFHFDFYSSVKIFTVLNFVEISKQFDYDFS